MQNYLGKLFLGILLLLLKTSKLEVGASIEMQSAVVIDPLVGDSYSFTVTSFDGNKTSGTAHQDVLAKEIKAAIVEPGTPPLNVSSDVFKRPYCLPALDDLTAMQPLIEDAIKLQRELANQTPVILPSSSDTLQPHPQVEELEETEDLSQLRMRIENGSMLLLGDVPRYLEANSSEDMQMVVYKAAGAVDTFLGQLNPEALAQISERSKVIATGLDAIESCSALVKIPEKEHSGEILSIVVVLGAVVIGVYMNLDEEQQRLIKDSVKPVQAFLGAVEVAATAELEADVQNVVVAYDASKKRKREAEGEFNNKRVRFSDEYTFQEVPVTQEDKPTDEETWRENFGKVINEFKAGDKFKNNPVLTSELAAYMPVNLSKTGPQGPLQMRKMDANLNIVMFEGGDDRLFYAVQQNNQIGFGVLEGVSKFRKSDGTLDDEKLRGALVSNTNRYVFNVSYVAPGHGHAEAKKLVDEAITTFVQRLKSINASADLTRSLEEAKQYPEALVGMSVKFMPSDKAYAKYNSDFLKVVKQAARMQSIPRVMVKSSTVSLSENKRKLEVDVTRSGYMPIKVLSVKTSAQVDSSNPYPNIFMFDMGEGRVLFIAQQGGKIGVCVLNNTGLFINADGSWNMDKLYNEIVKYEGKSTSGIDYVAPGQGHPNAQGIFNKGVTSLRGPIKGEGIVPKALTKALKQAEVDPKVQGPALEEPAVENKEEPVDENKEELEEKTKAQPAVENEEEPVVALTAANTADVARDLADLEKNLDASGKSKYYDNPDMLKGLQEVVKVVHILAKQSPAKFKPLKDKLVSAIKEEKLAVDTSPPVEPVTQVFKDKLNEGKGSSASTPPVVDENSLEGKQAHLKLLQEVNEKINALINKHTDNMPENVVSVLDELRVQVKASIVIVAKEVVALEAAAAKNNLASPVENKRS